MLGCWAVFALSQGWSIRASGAGIEFCNAQLALQLLDLFVLDFDHVDKHLSVFLIITHEITITILDSVFDLIELVLLDFNDLCSVAFFHVHLGLVKILILIQVVLILLLKELDLLCELGWGMLRYFLVLSLTDALESCNLALELLVLCSQSISSLCIILVSCTTWSKSSQLIGKLLLLSDCLLVCLVEFLILDDHALLLVEHHVKLFKLLAQENCLVSHHWID